MVKLIKQLNSKQQNQTSKQESTTQAQFSQEITQEQIKEGSELPTRETNETEFRDELINSSSESEQTDDQTDNSKETIPEKSKNGRPKKVNIGEKTDNTYDQELTEAINKKTNEFFGVNNRYENRIRKHTEKN